MILATVRLFLQPVGFALFLGSAVDGQTLDELEEKRNVVQFVNEEESTTYDAPDDVCRLFGKFVLFGLVDDVGAFVRFETKWDDQDDWCISPFVNDYVPAGVEYTLHFGATWSRVGTREGVVPDEKFVEVRVVIDGGEHDGHVVLHETFTWTLNGNPGPPDGDGSPNGPVGP